MGKKSEGIDNEGADKKNKDSIQVFRLQKLQTSVAIIRGGRELKCVRLRVAVAERDAVAAIESNLAGEEEEEMEKGGGGG